jgi:tetratricopeptide (TPR) repeat protein
MKEFTHFDKMDAYVRHAMTEEERKAFEQELETDSTLRKEWEVFQHMVEGAKAAGDHALKQAIARARTAPMQRRLLTLRWTLAAAAVVVLSLGIWWLQQPAMQDRTFEAYFTPEKKRLAETLDALESSGFARPEVSKSLLAGLKDYEKGNYAQASASLLQYLDIAGAGADGAAVFYLGLCYMEQGDYKKAIAHLEPLAAQIDASWQPDAEFYLALALLKTRDRKRAGALFEKMTAGSSHPYREKSAEILVNLKK